MINGVLNTDLVVVDVMVIEGTHATTEVAARLGEYDPAGHALHWLEFSDDHVSGPQLMHSIEPLPEYVPALHIWQTLALVAATELENVPWVQLRQLKEPCIDHVPALHITHLPVAFMKYPAIHSMHGVNSGV